MKNILLALIFLLPFRLFAQSIEVYDVQQEGNHLRVFYHFTGSGQHDVSLLYSLNNGSSWLGPARSVSGDAGTGILPGRGKSILWNVLADRPMLRGNELRFKVRASIKVRKEFESEMVFVQGGSFQMGSNDGESDERPVHMVQLSDFFMGKYEVTQLQWQMVMGRNPSYFKNCPDCPVEQVSWEDVQQFLQKLNAATGKNYRLPTEAEWEYAARGGNKSVGNKYSGSNDLNSVAWYSSNGDNKTHPVGQKQSNELGLFDMIGNVWEWCSDWYDENYYKSSPGANPLGAGYGQFRAERGGSWNNIPEYCRFGNRNWIKPESRSYHLGFRLALPPR